MDCGPMLLHWLTVTHSKNQPCFTKTFETSHIQSKRFHFLHHPDLSAPKGLGVPPGFPMAPKAGEEMDVTTQLVPPQIQVDPEDAPERPQTLAQRMPTRRPGTAVGPGTGWRDGAAPKRMGFMKLEPPLPIFNQMAMEREREIPQNWML